MTHSMRQEQRPARHRLLAILATAAVFATSSAHAQSSSDIHISAGSLEAALLTLAAQTHQQVFFSHDLVAGRNVAALNGAYTAEQALRLLAPDIAVTHAGPNVLVLRDGAAPRSPAQPDLSPRVAPAPQTAQISPPPDLATAPPTAAAGSAANLVSEIQVTGTHIRGGVSAAPLLVISHTDLERSGQTTLADALRVLPQNFTGGAAEGTVATGSDTVGRNQSFASGLNLRGLGNDATLVLIDGRRLAGSGAFGDFSDVSSVPGAAVERVEVLLDGASAVYGSDAVGGVVNIILRKDFDGAETRFLTGSSTAGGAAEAQFSQTFGKRWDEGGVLVVFEARGRNPLENSDRSFSSNADLRAFGGSDRRITTSSPGNIFNASFMPAFAIPAGQSGVGLPPSQLLAGVVNLQNQRLGEDILPSQTVQTLYLSGDQAFGERLTVSADARLSRRNFKASLADDIATLRVTSANPFFVSPPGGASETIGFSFANDLPNPSQSGYAETLGGSLGGTLKLWGDWQANGYATFAQEIDQVNNYGVINSLLLNEALGNTPDNPATPFSAARDGFFNPFAGVAGANKPAVLSAISSGFLRSRGRDQVYSANLQADGTIWTLPGGPIKVAFGVQARTETFRRLTSSFVSAATPIASAPADDARNVEVGFVEVQVPLFSSENRLPGLERLELSLAGRVEHYQAIGTTKNPKVGVLWSPAAGLAFRTTYGTSFRAPALRELDDPSLFSPTQFPLNGGLIRTLLLAGGNPNLRPETATSWTAGVDYSPPRTGLRLGATWYDIQFKNRIGSPVSQDLVGALSDPTLSSFVDRITPTTNAADLAKITALLASPAVSTLNGVFSPTAFLAIVDNRFVNTSALHVGGIDLSAGYGFDLGGDRIALGANSSYTLEYDQQVTPTSRPIDEVGIVNFPVRFNARATADWTRDRLSAGVALNYASAYRDSLGVQISAQPTLDVQLRLAPAAAGMLKGTAVSLNIRNVLDRAPPFYNNPFGYAYDPSVGDPIGRFVSLQLLRAW